MTPDWTVDTLEKYDHTLAHALIGSVYVKGAQPGDALEVEVLTFSTKGGAGAATLRSLGCWRKISISPICTTVPGRRHLSFWRAGDYPAVSTVLRRHGRGPGLNGSFIPPLRGLTAATSTSAILAVALKYGCRPLSLVRCLPAAIVTAPRGTARFAAPALSRR